MKHYKTETRLILLSAVACVLLACGKATGPVGANMQATVSADTYLPAPAQKSQAVLGKGYNTKEERFVGECAIGDIEFAGMQNASIRFDRSLSEKETSDSLGFSVGGRARYGLIEASGAADFAKASAANAYSESTTYAAVYQFKNAKLKYTGLSPQGALAQKSHNWELTCGHEFVEQIELGAQLYINAKIEFSSKEEKESFNATLNVKGPAFSLGTTLSQASHSFGRTASVSIRVFQVGGNVSQLSSVFSKSAAKVDTKTEEKNGKGASASALLTCGMDQMDSCLEVLDNALEYATSKDDPNAFPAQINFKTLDTSTPNGPAMLKYITKPWSILAIYPPNPMIEEAVKAARKKLSFLFEESLKSSNRSQALLSGKIRLSPKQYRTLLNIDDRNSSNLAKILEASNVCYDDLANCNSAVAQVSSAIEHFEESQYTILPETFAQYCDNAKLPIHRVSLATTVEALLKVAHEDLSGPITEDLCGAAGQILEERVELSLPSKGVSVLGPIAALPKLQSLNLRDNKISDISKLANLVIGQPSRT
ncbi:leucine-rich repeat domain-containing protein [Bdellovibrionota bacterium FG-2]